MPVKIIHERDICIGCGACAAVCPDFWVMGKDGKSDLVGSKKDVLSAKEVGCNKEAAQGCPVNCIHIEEGGKRTI